MTRAAMLFLTIGTALFVGLLAWQGFGSVAATLMTAGWGLLVVAAFHGLPLVLDAASIFVLFDRDRRRSEPGLPRFARLALLARWAGESVNSLLPAGQIGGPVLMARHLSQHGMPMPEAAAAILVSTTMQTFAQIVFALFGFALFALQAAHGVVADLRIPLAIAVAVLSIVFVAFFVAQRNGLFGKALRMASTAFGTRRWAGMASQADAIDAAVGRLYGEHRKVVATFVLALVAWLVGTGEVWLALQFLGHPVDWVDALLLESVGQAIRGAAFAIPGSLGFQEGGYLLLAPLVGLPPEAALALSLAKRAREIALGVPGIVYLHLNERFWQRRAALPLPVVERPLH